MMGPESDLRPYSSEIVDGALHIVIEREFDFGNLHQDWAVSILSRHPGPFSKVKMDMAKCARVSSTFYAGLMQLHFTYNRQGNNPIVLSKLDPRIVANLKVLHLESYFSIEG